MTFATRNAVATVDTIPLWLCFLVVAIFLAFGMVLGYRAFKSSIR
jgi:predicted Na+-dependent transporter